MMTQKTPRHRLAAAVLWGLSTAACSAAAGPTYITQATRLATLREQIFASGEISARRRIQVGSQISGTVERVAVDFNSQVAAGDLLAVLDTRLLRAALARAEAAVAVAEAHVARADVSHRGAGRTLGRSRELTAQKMIARADLDAAEVEHEVAAASLRAARAELARARADRSHARTQVDLAHIRSPIDGVVIDRQVHPGQTVAAGFQVTTLFVIANDLRQVKVLAEIDEADVGRVRPGMAADFGVDAFVGERFAGTVRMVRQAPTPGAAAGGGRGATSTVVTYAADIAADNADGRLRQGMTAHVTLLAGEARDVVVLPNAALRFAPPGPPGRAPEGPPAAIAAGDEAPAAGRPGEAYVLTEGAPRRVHLRLGITDGQATEVLWGLGAGAEVITAVAPGQAPRRGIL